MTTTKGERLQKVLARAGVASRRHAEELITAGRVRVNGRVVTEMGVRVDPRRDKVELDGKRLVSEPLVHVVMHKPRGVMTTLSDPEGRPTVADILKNLPARVYPVGRLDFHTSGVMLATNDGALAQALLHPRKAVAKVYVCKVRGVVTDLQLDKLREGVMLAPSESDPGEAPRKTLPADVKLLRHTPSMVSDERGEPINDGATWMEVTLREGRTRQIHRMAEAVGLFVMRLARISFAGITAEGLRPGEKRTLTDDEVTLLRREYLRASEAAAFAKGHDGDYPEEVEEETEAAPVPVRKRVVKRPGGQAGRVVGESVSRAREAASGTTRSAKAPAASTRRETKAPAVTTRRENKAPAGRGAPKQGASTHADRGAGGPKSGGRGGRRGTK
nr:rRNA pseudouridine synthase [Deltaproteobacteria bacterium]